MKTVLVVAAWLLVDAGVSRAEPPPLDDAAECFCDTVARDLQLGHFEEGGSFVVDVPLWPGPDGPRAVGDIIMTGLSGVPTGPAIVIDQSDGGGTWCTMAVGSAEPDETTLTSVSCDQPPTFGIATCDASLTLRQVGQLVLTFPDDAQCIARAHALGVPSPFDDGCSGGALGPWALAFAVGFVATRRSSRVSVERR